MTDATNFTIPAGLPFARRIRVVGGKDVWPNLADFEVRAQLRKQSSPSSTLIADLHDYMTASYGTGDQADDIIIDWSMTGAETKAIDATGYYDVIVSDADTDDARAIRLLFGKFTFTNLVTKAEGTT